MIFRVYAGNNCQSLIFSCWYAVRNAIHVLWTSLVVEHVGNITAAPYLISFPVPRRQPTISAFFNEHTAVTSFPSSPRTHHLMSRTQHASTIHIRTLVAAPMPSTRRRTVLVTEPEPSPPHQYPKRSRISSISDREHLKKRRRLSEDIRPPQLKIPVRNKVLQRGDSPNAVSHPVLLRNAEATQAQIESGPSTPASNEYTHFQRIEKEARAYIRGGGQDLPIKVEKRSLRSHDGGSRSFRSELASYFNNFDQMISLEPPKPGKPITNSTQNIA